MNPCSTLENWKACDEIKPAALFSLQASLTRLLTDDVDHRLVIPGYNQEVSVYITTTLNDLAVIG